MPDSPAGENEAMVLLEASFAAFNEATVRLQEAYARLERKFDSLNRDLEQKNRALEEAIAEKEDMQAYLRNVLESLMTGIAATSLEGRVQTVNRCAEELLGVSQEWVQGMLIQGLLPQLAEQDWPLQSCGDDPGQRIQHEGKVLEVHGSTVLDRAGQGIGYVFLIRDVTRIEELEDMAKRTQKLAAMGELAASVAHEIRNPLGSIELFASLLLKDLKGQKQRARVLQIIRAVQSMDNKITNLLLFTRDRQPRMVTVRIHDVIREILQFVGDVAVQEGVALSVRYAQGDPLVEGDTEMLKQVFLNLILNALQALPGEGHLSLRTRLTDRAKGAVIEIVISDDGPGIPPGDRAKIFDPFFTTKEKGAGLGLTIVRHILDMHQGRIDVEPRRGGGTVFILSLPLVRDSAGGHLSGSAGRGNS